MNNQLREACKQAVRDLLAQNEFGFAKGSCFYLTPQGTSCIVGLLLRRHFPEVKVDNLFGGVGSIMQYEYRTKLAEPRVTLRSMLRRKFGSMTLEDTHELAGMQIIHDSAARLAHGASPRLAHDSAATLSVRDALMQSITGHQPDPDNEGTAGYAQYDKAAAIYLEVLNEPV